jgi:enamine deaminase RidA (YjgF/YER057c/UK114 family)
MSIIRHEIRKISDENRGQPIISQAVVHGNVAYFAGVTPDPIIGDIKTQTVQVLRRFWRPGMLVEVMVVAALP